MCTKAQQECGRHREAKRNTEDGDDYDNGSAPALFFGTYSERSSHSPWGRGPRLCGVALAHTFWPHQVNPQGLKFSKMEEMGQTAEKVEEWAPSLVMTVVHKASVTGPAPFGLPASWLPGGTPQASSLTLGPNSCFGTAESFVISCHVKQPWNFD